MRVRPVSLSLSQYAYDCLRQLAANDNRSLSYMACVAIGRLAEASGTGGLSPNVLREIKTKHEAKRDEKR